MKLPVYIQGLRAHRYVCLVKADGEPVAVLSLWKTDYEYDEAKALFKKEVGQMKQDYPATYTINYYG